MEQQKKTREDLEQDTVDLVYDLANGFVTGVKILFWIFVICVVVGGITVYNFIPS